MPERAALADGTHVAIRAGSEVIRQGEVVRYADEVCAGESRDCLWDPEATCAWASQLHGGGKLYASDLNRGPVVLGLGQ